MFVDVEQVVEQLERRLEKWVSAVKHDKKGGAAGACAQAAFGNGFAVEKQVEP